MNYYFFALKRSFHSVLRISRDVAAAFELTPARADMLMFLRIFDSDVFGFALDCAFSRDFAPTNEAVLQQWRDRIYEVTSPIRYAFRDRATLEYPGIDPEAAASFWVRRSR